MLHGRYRIIQQVGKGGMGAVYKATDSQLGDRLVAVKEMSQSGLSVSEIADAAKHFKAEAVMLARLSHPSLPKVFDHFEEGNRWYLVMDFIEGQTLEAHLSAATGHQLPVKEVLDIGKQLCSVLEYLHSQRPPIIFRDLKPSNVMVTSVGTGYPKAHLIDFGIARLFKAGKAADTVALGSPGYAAPEQYGKAQTTERSDIYSLGATMHHLLTGIDPANNPFHFTPVRTVQAQIPPELERLIANMVEMDPNNRPSSVKVVRQQMERIRLSLTP
jgi:serine/threonine protein kinase